MTASKMSLRTTPTSSHHHTPTSSSTTPRSLPDMAIHPIRVVHAECLSEAVKTSETTPLIGMKLTPIHLMARALATTPIMWNTPYKASLLSPGHLHMDTPPLGLPYLGLTATPKQLFASIPEAPPPLSIEA